MFDKILLSLGLNAQTQAPILILVGSGILVWWVYSRGKEDIQRKDSGMKESLDSLYFPAQGMILHKNSGKMTDEEFDKEFSKLLISSRSKSESVEIRESMNEWLSGTSNITEMQILLENEIQRIVRKRRRPIFVNTLSWISTFILDYFALFALFWGIIVSSVAFLTWWLSNFELKTLGVITLGIDLLLLIAFGLFFLKQWKKLNK